MREQRKELTENKKCPLKGGIGDHEIPHALCMYDGVFLFSVICTEPDCGSQDGQLKRWFRIMVLSH